ncbi:MAG TPA: PilZ domain-containing protein [Candidatus Sulfotelmatobacter sp.]|jgi:CheY-like chemotaxis protein|nr:PilZ domain-containing protein [Candidatus Sulfotelmatobacter sp.]
MNLQALLVTSDDAAADVLGTVLSGYRVASERLSDLEAAMERLQQQKFDALVVDFEDPATATSVLEQTRKLGIEPVTIAMVPDGGTVREILNQGTHFVLHKPVREEAATAGLRAAAALLNHERRRAYRVPVQAPVDITLPDGRKSDGILLDLSETGMDVLTAEPQTAGNVLELRFQLSDGSVDVQAHGQAVWANPNGQTGIHFQNLPEMTRIQLKNWLRTAAMTSGAGPDETVPHCKLTDLSLNGCYVQTEAPFPERSLVDFCLKTNQIEVHTQGMVRVVHPGQGMGVEFPSRTAEQRAQVGELINFLRTSPDAMPELSVSPLALVADITQYEPADNKVEEPADEWEDPLLELLRRGHQLQQEEFLQELCHQRNPEDLTTA